MIKNKYRVVRDGFAGYEAQVWQWWFPFWMEMGYKMSWGTNTHYSLQSAINFIKSRGVVWESDTKK